MKKDYPNVSVITVNFNGKKYLREFFNSVFRLNYPKDKLDVIFVDNVSTDDSVRFVRKNYPKVRIVNVQLEEKDVRTYRNTVPEFPNSKTIMMKSIMEFPQVLKKVLMTWK